MTTKSDNSEPTHGIPCEEDVDNRTLERNLGLPTALSVGVGTMIGAGIFVFPGIAVGQVGPAATISFAIGAVIALLVAFPAAELATDMPKSGGAYFFSSRGLGTAWGVIAGVCQTLGLVFAAAFYLVGAGRYLGETVAMLGFDVQLSATWTAFLVALALVGMAIISTRVSGQLQNIILYSLLFLLFGFLGYGGLGLAEVVDVSTRKNESFFTTGWIPILTTSALVFTSYLGFAQIAAIAGEIRRPARNIPLAMVGSILLVGLLYIVTVYLSTRYLSPEQMNEFGETAMIEVARKLAGTVGVAVFLTGGILATLSSANASILSSSRSLFALGADELIPEKTSQVNRKFGTPHVALLTVGLPVAALTLVGKLDLLAQVASLLHLVLYALICFALLALRHRRPEPFEPDYCCPGYPLVPILGGIACIGLIFFMDLIAQIISAIILIAAWIWYRVKLRDIELRV